MVWQSFRARAMRASVMEFAMDGVSTRASVTRTASTTVTSMSVKPDAPRRRPFAGMIYLVPPWMT